MARVKIFDDNGKLITQPSEVYMETQIGKSQKGAVQNIRSEKISNIINGGLQWYKQKPCKDDTEVALRLENYFNTCSDLGQLPTIESMCLCLGITRQTLRNWENAATCSKSRSDMVNKAKELIANIDAQLVSEGAIPQVTYIFRAKNYYGMTDKNELQITATNKFEDYDEDEIKKRIDDTIIIDEID